MLLKSADTMRPSGNSSRFDGPAMVEHAGVTCEKPALAVKTIATIKAATRIPIIVTPQARPDLRGRFHRYAVGTIPREAAGFLRGAGIECTQSGTGCRTSPPNHGGRFRAADARCTA